MKIRIHSLMVSLMMASSLSLSPLVFHTPALAQTSSDASMQSNPAQAAATGSEHTVLPEGVTVIDFGNSPTITVAGSLTNNGTLYAISTNPAVTSASISAQNIFNMPGAVITTVIPAGGLTGFANPVMNLNLVLNAVQNIVNGGTIASAGSLSAIAGGSITNALPAGIVGSFPAMTALQNLNLQASNITNMGVLSAGQNLNLQAIDIMNAGTISSYLGNITAVTSNLANQGSIQALSGNISLQNMLNSILSINNTAGELLAAGNLAILSKSSDLGTGLLKSDLSIINGFLEGQNGIALTTDGHLELDIDDINGALSISACTADIAVNHGTHGMNLVDMTMTGDPNLVFVGAGPFVNGAFNADGGFVNIDTSADLVTGSIQFTGAITTTPAAAGPAGSVTLNAGTTITTLGIVTTPNGAFSAGAVNLTANGAISTAGINSSGGTGSASAITITSTGGSISTGVLNASSTTGTSADITLDSGTATFSTASIQTNSTNNAPGNLTFKQGATVLTTPTVTFAVASNVLVNGKTAGITPSVAFNLGNSNSLANINTTNTGTGGAGSITLNSTTDITTSILGSNTTGGGNAGAIILKTTGGFIDTQAYNSSSSSGNGSGGAISMTATGKISTLTLNSIGTNGPGGTITLDSGTGTFSTGNLQTFSTGAAPGGLVFKQNGVVLAQPTVSFVAGSAVLVSGKSASATPTLSFNLGNANALASLNTQNVGTGGAGSVILNSAFPISTSTIITLSNGGAGSGPAGSISLTSTGSITTLTQNAAGVGANTKGGDITLDSGTGVFNLATLQATGSPPGTLTFKQGGVVLASPTVSFSVGAGVLLNGPSSSTTSSINIIMGNNNALTNFNTQNSGSGSSGSITLTNPGGPLTIANAVTSTTGAGNAGAINLTAKAGAVTTSVINAAGTGTGAGGNVAIDSSTATFNTASIITSSAASTAGTITFLQNGVVIPTPTVSFTAGSSILASGKSAASTQSLSFILGNANALNVVNTQNFGTGSAGSITLSSAFPITTGNIISITAGAGNAGAVNVTSAGGITTATINTAGTGTGKGGNVVLDSATSTFALGSIQTSSVTTTAGDLQFKTGGVLIPTPTVSFTAGAQLLVSGNSATPTPSLSFILGNNNALGNINTSNAGSGAAGSVSLVAPAALTTGNITTSAVSGPGGDITLDSATASFTHGSLDTHSVTNKPGIITYKQAGVTLGNPTVSFNAGSSINASGVSATPTTSLNITLGNANTLGSFNTSNGGAGGAGAISLSSVNPIVTTGINGGAVNVNSTGSVTVNGNVVGTGNVSLTTGAAAANSLNIGSNSVIGASVNLNTATLNLSGSVLATTGNLSVQSLAPGNPLTMNLGSGAALSAVGAGKSVLFNPVAGPITALQGFGILTGTTVNFNGGAGAVNVIVETINGQLTGTGTPFNVIQTKPNVTPTPTLTATLPSTNNQALLNAVFQESIQNTALVGSSQTISAMDQENLFISMPGQTSGSNIQDGAALYASITNSQILGGNATTVRGLATLNMNELSRQFSAVIETGGLIDVGSMRRSNDVDSWLYIIKNFEANVIFFVADNQVFSASSSDEDCTLTGKRGTMAKKKKKNVYYLHVGSLVADAGKYGVTIETERGAVTLKPETTAVISVQPGRPVEIDVLGGEDPEAVSVQADSEATASTLAAGQRMLVSKQDLTEEELIPIDSDGKEVISAKLTVVKGKPNMATMNIALESYADRYVTIAGRSIKLPGPDRNGVNRMAKHVSDAASRQRTAMASTGKPTLLDPISASAKSQPLSGLVQAVMFSAEADTRFTTPSKNLFDLKSGGMFMDLPKGVQIRTTDGTVMAQESPALVSVGYKDEGFRLQACSVPSNLQIDAGGGDRIVPAGGDEIFLANHRPSREEAVPLDNIARRQIVVHALDAKRTAVLSEVSLMSLIASSQSLGKLRNPQTLEDRKLREQILKTAAILNIVTRSHGPYLGRSKNVSSLPESFYSPDLEGRRLGIFKQDTEKRTLKLSSNL